MDRRASRRPERPVTGGTVPTALDAVGWPVRTERLVLRPAGRDDLEATWAFRRLAAVSRWLTRAPQTLGAYRAHFLEPASLAVTVVIVLDGEVIGDLMLKVEDGWTQAEVRAQGHAVQAELGWVLHPDHAGRGYATEAVRELVRICFDELGLRRVTATCFAANESSWRLMERVGMRRELHAVRESLHRSGEWLDVHGYALLAEEWHSRDAAGAADANPERLRVPGTATSVARRRPRRGES